MKVEYNAVLLGGDFELKKLFDFTVLFILNDFLLLKLETVFPDIPILFIGSIMGLAIKSLIVSFILIYMKLNQK